MTPLYVCTYNTFYSSNWIPCYWYFLTYRGENVCDDIDCRSDEACAEHDEERELRVEQVLAPSPLEVAEVVADDANVDQTYERNEQLSRIVLLELNPIFGGTTLPRMRTTILRIPLIPFNFETNSGGL